MSWSTSELRVRFAPWNRFKPSTKIFYWPFQGGTSFVDLLCFFSIFVFVMPLCASVYVCLVVSCLERADLLSLAVVSNCEFITFPLVSWVRCDTWLYRFLIFAPLLTLVCIMWLWLLLVILAYLTGLRDFQSVTPVIDWCNQDYLLLLYDLVCIIQGWQKVAVNVLSFQKICIYSYCNGYVEFQYILPKT